MRSTSNRESNCFDFLRLFAATCVLFSHSVEHLKLPFLWLREGSSGSYWFYDGVPLFFVMSGFLIYKSYGRCVERGLPRWNYFINRYLRIAPALYAYVFVTTIILLAVRYLSIANLLSGSYLKWVVLNLFLLPKNAPALFAGYGTGGINGSLWTIPVEFGFYLVIPLIYALEKRWGFGTAIALLLLVSVCGIVADGRLAASAPASQVAKLLEVTFVPYTIFFGLGIFWSKYWMRVPHRSLLALMCLLIYCCLRIFNVLHVSIGHEALFIEGSTNPLFCFAWSIPLSYAVLWFAHYGPAYLSTFTRRIGDLSYGVYIWHMVVVNTVLYIGLKARLSAVPGAVQTVVVTSTFVLALMSWHLVEKRALRWKPYTSRPAPLPGLEEPAVKDANVPLRGVAINSGLNNS